MGQPAFDFRRLSIAERLQLVEDIWDSIAEETQGLPDKIPLTEAQRVELRRRRDEHELDPGSAIPWEKVREDLFESGE